MTNSNSIGYAERLNANCFNNGNNTGTNLLKTLSYHIVFSSPTCTAQLNGGYFACGSSPLLVPPVPYTQGYPVNYVPPNGSTVFGRKYGASSQTDATILTRLDGEPVWFTAGDLAPLLPKAYCPAPYNVYKRSGPAYKNCTAFGSLDRADPTDPIPVNRKDYAFLDAFLTVPDAERNVKLCETGDKICPTNNWLTVAGLGNDVLLPLFSTIPSPFTITSHFEQSGSNAPYNALGNGYIPFCANLNARLETGEIIGYYSGLCFSLIFSPAAITYGPVNPYLPQNEWSPVPPPKPPVDPHRAFYTLELSTYYRGHTTDANYPIGSPLISKQRYYLYVGPENTNYQYPFRILFQEGIYGSNPVLLTFNTIDAAPTTLNIDLTGQKVLITY